MEFFQNCYWNNQHFEAFIIQAINNDPITIYGDGSQTRSFCYIDDLITGVVNLMNIDYIGPVNLGNPDTINILELAKIILKLTNSNSEIITCTQISYTWGFLKMSYY